MTFLERVLLTGMKRLWIRGSDVRVLLRLMREYEQCWNSGAQLPDIPKRLKRRIFPLSVWAGLILSLRNPSLFAAGVFLILPAGLITFYWLVIRMTSLINRWMGA